EFDQATVDAARKLIQAENLYGQGSVMRLTGTKLPYADELINRVVVEDVSRASAHGITLGEILRITIPHGTVVLMNANRNKLAGELKALGIRNADLNATPAVVTKPRPSTMDDWTHFKHSASGNPVSRDSAINSPTGVKWLAGPRYTRGKTRGSVTGSGQFRSMHTTLSHNGINFYFTRGDCDQSQYENRASVLARDAFNGVKLWERHWSMVSSKSIDGMRGKGFPLMVAHDGKVFSLYKGRIGILDARTGEVLATHENGFPLNMIAFVGVVVLTFDDRVVAYDASTHKLLWKKEQRIRTTVGMDSRIFFLEDGGKNAPPRLVCCHVRGGDEVWRADASAYFTGKNDDGNINAEQNMRTLQIAFCEGDYICMNTSLPGGMIVASAKDGRYAWGEWQGVLGEPVLDRRGESVKWKAKVGGTQSYWFFADLRARGCEKWTCWSHGIVQTVPNQERPTCPTAYYITPSACEDTTNNAPIFIKDALPSPSRPRNPSRNAPTATPKTSSDEGMLNGRGRPSPSAASPFSCA
ncbi:MAG: PQQ-binding-like beta-propeller repeat protein, partial [Planctomycetales bacterium]